MLKLQIKEPKEAQRFADDSIGLSVQNGFPIIGDLSKIVLGRAYASLGRAAEGVSLIREAIDALPQTDRNGMTLFLSWLAESEALNGAMTDALVTIERALGVNPMARAWSCDALRIRGEFRAQTGQTTDAEADFREAIARAQQIGAKALELRAALGLARILARGDRIVAADLLGHTYGGFAEGFDTADLRDAQALLEQLSSSS
jgi:tetratricopeptide (TPR) repeat protein